MMLEGLRLMAVGMTTVFGFLTLLVVAVHATQRVVSWFPEPEPPPSSPPRDADEAIAAVLAIVAAQRGGR